MIPYNRTNKIEPIGTIVNKVFTNADNFTLVNGPNRTWNIANGRYELRSTGGGDFQSYIKFTDATNPHRFTMLDHWKMSVRFDTVRSATNFGIALGVHSIRTGDIRSNAARLCAETGNASFSGRFLMYLLQVTNSIDPSTRRQEPSTTGLPVPPADSADSALLNNTQYWFEVEKEKNLTHMRLWNADYNTVLLQHTFTHSITWFTNFFSSGIQLHNTGEFTLWFLRGTFNIYELVISSNEIKNPYWAFIGDSNMQGYFTSNIANRYTTQAAGTYPSVVLAGLSDRLIEVQARLPEILAINPRNVYINIGSNDITNANNPTWATNYTTVLNTLLNAGINVVVGTPLARNGVDFQPIVDYFNTNYPNLIQADVWNQTRTGTNLLAAYNSGDNIHASPDGNNLLRDFLKPFIDRT